MSYFVERLPLNKIEKRTQLVLSLIPLTNDLKEKVGLSVLDKAAGKFLEDGLISNDEQIQLDDFRTLYNFQQTTYQLNILDPILRRSTKRRF